MTQIELRVAVRDMLQDAAGVHFDDGVIDRHTTSAIRRVERAVGKTQKRLFEDLQTGVQTYPLGSGILRIITVEILPENGTKSTKVHPLQEVDLAAIPPELPENRDPDRYAINMAGGANENEFELVFFPAPARDTVNSIVVTYDGDFVTGAEIPFPETFDLIIQRLTAAGCLSEEDDETSIRKGEYFSGLAERELGDLAWMGSLSDVNNIVRTFP